MGYSAIQISGQSLQYVGVPVKALLTTGVPFDPTGDPVAMAFMPQATQAPGSGDWKTAIWATRASDIIFPYAALCLVGPGGTIELDLGTYYMYVKVTDNPEIPVLLGGILGITT